MKDQNYLVIDLELNDKNDGTDPRIIQVGACVGSPLRPDKFSTYSWYLDPEEPVTPSFSKLTGITDEIIREKVVSHQQVADELGRVIGLCEPFVNPTTGGQGDSDELKVEFRERGVNFPHFGRRILDVKTTYVFSTNYERKATFGGGLRKSMLPPRVEVFWERRIGPITTLSTHFAFSFTS
jgi:hypothetical protein